MNAIEISELSHHFGENSRGLEKIQLTITSGEFVVLAGPNGSGKTTLCRLLTGLATPQQGNIRIFDIPVKGNESQIRKQIGMVFQNADAQIIGDTVYNDIAFGPENSMSSLQEINAIVEKSLNRFNLKHLQHHNPGTLSGGEKRRLAIAGTLALNPNIIIFDEPFSNLDYPSTQQVLNIILELKAAGHTILIVTHELEKMIAHADRLIILQDGKIALDDIPSRILPQVEAYGIREPCFSKYQQAPDSWQQ